MLRCARNLTREFENKAFGLLVCHFRITCISQWLKYRPHQSSSKLLARYLSLSASFVIILSNDDHPPMHTCPMVVTCAWSPAQRVLSGCLVDTPLTYFPTNEMLLLSTYKPGHLAPWPLRCPEHRTTCFSLASPDAGSHLGVTWDGL